jgi:UDP-3-O-acyl-N-acetylglucosamine deacetylase
MPFTVTQRSGGGGDEDDVSFVSFYPGGSVTRVSYGIDFVQKARVIGRQWYSWSPDLEKEDDDDGYVNQIAPARTFCCSQDIPLMRDMGLIRGGSEECAMIANGSEWVNPSKVRFHHEQARHKILDLVGDLALVAQGGNAALPLGHIVAYKAGHNLHLKFAKELVKRIDRLHKDKEQTINLD